MLSLTMLSFTRKFLAAAILPCFVLVLGASPALAKTTSHKHHATRHHKSSRHHHVTRGSEITRIAQRHLANLGYYNGGIDGLMGPQTREAIRKFQSEHNLKPDGVLSSKTQSVLASADLGPVIHIGGAAPVPANPNAEVNLDYAPSLNGDAKGISSRFARLDVHETGAGPAKRYVINLNGQSILVADGQPSVVGMSPTYDLGTEDAVIFTTFSPSDTGCTYRNHVLVMNNAGSNILDIGNCTRDYQAQVNHGSLYVTFGEPDDARVVGATWRLEGVSLERL